MLIVLNNKSNLNKQEFLDYQEKLKKIRSNHQLVLCPSNIYLSLFSCDNFLLGTQNVSEYSNGAYTGEVSATQLKSLDVKYSLVGHSERRNYFKETNNNILNKINQLITNDIIPILCIGEQKEETKKHDILEQLEILNNIKNSEKLIIAYEPEWAIGTGITPTIQQIEEKVKLIKKYYPNNLVIYGGSINDSNIENLKTNLLDGYLLGGLSLDIEKLQILLNKLD